MFDLNGFSSLAASRFQGTISNLLSVREFQLDGACEHPFFSAYQCSALDITNKIFNNEIVQRKNFWYEGRKFLQNVPWLPILRPPDLSLPPQPRLIKMFLFGWE